MRASVLGQIPDPYAARSVAAYNFALVRVNDHIVGWASMIVASLDRPRPRFPNLDSAVFRARHHPFALAVECHSSNVPRMSLKCKQRIGICRLDIVKLDCVMAGCC